MGIPPHSLHFFTRGLAVMMLFWCSMAAAQTANTTQPAPLALERPIDVVLPAKDSAPAPMPSAQDILSPQTYTKATVKVDKVAETSEQARAEAYLDAEVKALEQVLRRQIPERAEMMMRQLDPQRIKAMVRNYDVKNEIKTATTYQATLTLTFDPKDIESLIGGRIRAVADTGVEPIKPLDTKDIERRSMLFIPIYATGGSSWLWEPENRWRKALNRAALELGQGRIILPTGDTKDMRDITFKKATDGLYADFQPALARYGTKEAVVLIASQEKAEASQPLNITIRLIRSGSAENVYKTIRARAQENDAERLERAAREIIEQAQEEFRETPTVQTKDEEQTILAIAQLDRAIDWANMRRKLEALPMIKSFEPTHVGTDLIEMRLVFRGSPKAFGKALKESGVYVIPLKNKLQFSFHAPE